MKIYTVGYEGSDIDDFTLFLHKNKIRRIVDVRKNPVSRKKGFSKHKLAAKLKEKKIEYTHFKGLGVPTEWRKLAKAHIITREKMFQDYVQKILPVHQEEIQLLIKLIKEEPTAILCYEADFSDCHRSFVVEEIKRTLKKKVQVVNLQIPLKSKKSQKGGRIFGISHPSL